MHASLPAKLAVGPAAADRAEKLTQHYEYITSIPAPASARAKVDEVHEVHEVHKVDRSHTGIYMFEILDFLTVG